MYSQKHLSGKILYLHINSHIRVSHDCGELKSSNCITITLKIEKCDIAVATLLPTIFSLEV